MAETPQSPAAQFEALAKAASHDGEIYAEGWTVWGTNGKIARCDSDTDADFIAWCFNSRALISSALRAGESNDGWKPIETAPKMKVLLLFAVSDVDGNGAVRNWKMATGSYHTGYVDDEKYSPWEWDGRQLRSYDLQPTHWRPLPLPPQPAAGEVG